MSSAIRFPVQPRLLPLAKAARVLHMDAAEFLEKLPALRREGFPAPCPATERFDRVAIDNWIDRMSGLKPVDTAEERAAIIKSRIDALG